MCEVTLEHAKIRKNKQEMSDVGKSALQEKRFRRAESFAPEKTSEIRRAESFCLPENRFLPFVDFWCVKSDYTVHGLRVYLKITVVLVNVV